MAGRQVSSGALVLAIFATTGLAAFATGCGGGQSAEQKQLAEMRETLARVQTEHDKMAERIARLEIDDPHATQDSTYGIAKTPTLKVVHVGPSMAMEDETSGASAAGATAKAPSSDDPDDGSARPVIRLTGQAGRDRRTGVHAADNGAQDPEARKAYDDALAKVQKKEYTAGADAFTAFLVKWPDHPRADNAMYWRGECYFAQGDFNRAESEFAGTVARFPGGQKAPDALLKLAMSEEKLGQTAEAKGSYTRLAHEFPHSDAARKVPANMMDKPLAPSEESR